MSKLQRPHLLGLNSNSEQSFLRPPWVFLIDKVAHAAAA
jgi:hypothetical protein